MSALIRVIASASEGADTVTAISWLDIGVAVTVAWKSSGLSGRPSVSTTSLATLRVCTRLSFVAMAAVRIGVRVVDEEQRDASRVLAGSHLRQPERQEGAHAGR